METVRLRLIYDGSGPIVWSRKPGAFGVQDKASVLHVGTAMSDGTTVFDLDFQLKAGAAEAPVLSGPFAHGPPARRFLYLGWRNEQGAFAQRLKLPLDTIGRDDIRRAIERQQPLVGRLVDRDPRVTSTGANIGGTRPITWVAPSTATAAKTARP